MAQGTVITEDYLGGVKQSMSTNCTKHGTMCLKFWYEFIEDYVLIYSWLGREFYVSWPVIRKAHGSYVSRFLLRTDKSRCSLLI